MKKATINLSGLGRIFVPGIISDDRKVYLCSSVTKDGNPINLTVKQSSTAKTHYTKAYEAEAAGYYLSAVAPNVFLLVWPTHFHTLAS